MRGWGETRTGIERSFSGQSISDRLGQALLLCGLVTGFWRVNTFATTEPARLMMEPRLTALRFRDSINYIIKLHFADDAY
jgi:hypothetical protein